MADNPLEQTSALAAYGNARTNDLRRYPSPDRDGSRLYPLAAPSAKPSFRINKADKIFTIGSCFARNVEAALEDVGMEVVSNETNLGPVGDSLGFAANFFNKYSIHSIYNDLKWAFERDSYPGDDIIYEMQKPGLYADLQLGMSKLDFPIEDIRDFRNRYLDVMARAAEADVVIVTLGYVETWYDTKLGIYLNTSPPQPLVKADPDRFEFRVLSYSDVIGALRDLHALLLKHRDRPLKMLVTVSPVPLLSTFRDIDVLVANTYSKSVQRAAIDEFVRDAEGVDYFPSYEFVMLSNPSVAWSRGDYRHVSPDLVARIMSNVITQYVEVEGDGAATGAMTTAALQSSARMLYKIADYDGVKALGKEYPEQFGSDPDLLIVLGNAFLKTRDVETAFGIFDAARALAPGKPAPLERLIALCRPTRKPDLAKELLAEHARRFPNRENFRKNAQVR